MARVDWRIFRPAVATEHGFECYWLPDDKIMTGAGNAGEIAVIVANEYATQWRL